MPNGNAPVAPAPTAKQEPKYRVESATMLATRPVNFFIPNTKVPMKDENGQLISDPRKVEVILATDRGIEPHTVLKEALTADRGQVNVVYATIDGYNESKEFVYAVGKG